MFACIWPSVFSISARVIGIKYVHHNNIYIGIHLYHLQKWSTIQLLSMVIENKCASVTYLQFVILRLLVVNKTKTTTTTKVPAAMPFGLCSSFDIAVAKSISMSVCVCVWLYWTAHTASIRYSQRVNVQISEGQRRARCCEKIV